MRNDPVSMRPFEAHLLPMLAQVAREVASPPDRAIVLPNSSRWRKVALVLATGLSVALVVPVLSDDPLGGALAIDRHGDTIYASVKDASSDPEAMTNDLRAHGLPAKVEVVPVSPSLEGTWVDIVNDNLDAGYNDPRISNVFQQITERPKVLEIPADFSTPFTLVVGRPAEAGETYNTATAADVEGAYGCLGLAGMTPDEAQEAITGKGYEALWYYERPTMPYTEVLDEVPSKKVILGAEFLGPTTVIIHTADAESNSAHSVASPDDAPANSC